MAPGRGVHAHTAEMGLAAAGGHVALGKFDAAVHECDEIAGAARRPELLERIAFETARVLFFQGMFDSSRAALLDIAVRYPDGLTANDALERALLIDEGKPRLFLERLARAEWLDVAGKADSALAVLSEVTGAARNDVVVGTAGLMRASVLRREGKDAQALAVLDDFVKEYPAGRLAPAALRDMGDTYAKNLDDREKAVAAYERLLIEYPESILAIEVRRTLERMKEIP